MQQQLPDPPARGRAGALFLSGVATGILVTFLALVAWARLAGPPRTTLAASPVPLAGPVASAPPAGNTPAPSGSNSPVSAPAPETPPASVPETAPPVAQEEETPSSSASGLRLPVAGIPLGSVHDTFHDMRGSVPHEALDIMAPTGTPVVAADDGVIRKLFESRKGGHTVYQFNPDETLCLYYAHLDRYAPDLAEGQPVHRGDVIGYVGASGNADPGAPHLHFAVTRLDAEKKWWTGTPVDPYPMLEGVPAR